MREIVLELLKPHFKDLRTYEDRSGRDQWNILSLHWDKCGHLAMLLIRYQGTTIMLPESQWDVADPNWEASELAYAITITEAHNGSNPWL